MTTYTWIGGDDSLADSAAWYPSLPGTPLGAGDILQFTGAATYTVTVSGPAIAPGGVTVTNPNATLLFTQDANTLTPGSLNLSAGALAFADDCGFTIAGSQTWTGGKLEFEGAQAVLTLGDLASDPSASTDVLGAGLRIDALSGTGLIAFGGRAGDSLTNNGTIAAQDSGKATLEIRDVGAHDIGFVNNGNIWVGGNDLVEQTGGPVVNAGSIQLTGAGFYYADATSFANTGSISVSDGGEFQTAHVGMTNSGSLNVTGGLAAIGGSLSDAAKGSIGVGGGGEVYVAGDLNGDVSFNVGKLAVGGALSGTLYGFYDHDTLDLFGLAYQTGKGALTLQSDTIVNGYEVYTYALTMPGAATRTLTFALPLKGPDGFDSGYPAHAYGVGLFELADDGAGGTAITFHQIASAGAFAAQKAAIDAQSQSFALTDSAVDVSANWSALDDSHLSSLTLNDGANGTTPVLNLTAAQFAGSAGLLAKITNSLFEVNVGGAITVYERGSGFSYESPFYLSGADVHLLGPGAIAVLGGGNVFTAASGSGLELDDTLGVWDTVYGSGVTISEWRILLISPIYGPVQVSVVGGGDTVELDNMSAVSLYDTAGAWDTVDLYSGELILTRAQASLLGGGDVVDFDASGADAVSLYDTAGTWDAIYGSHGAITLNAAQASVIGGDDVVYADGSASDALSLYDTAGAWDLVYGSHVSLDLNRAQASLIGGGDVVYLDASGADAVSLYDTADAWDVVYGSSGQIVLNAAQASVLGGGNTVYMDGSSADRLSLYNSTAQANIVEASGARIALYGGAESLNGDGNVVLFAGGDNAIAVSGGGETFQFGASLGLDAISGFDASDTIVLSQSDFADFAALAPHIEAFGADTRIVLDSANAITLMNVRADTLTASQFRFV